MSVENAPAARRLALSMVPPDAADDIVAEAFARVLAAIRAGGGPDRAFRGYLLAAVRNAANDWIAGRRRVTVIGDMDEESGDHSARLTMGFSSGAEVLGARAARRRDVRADVLLQVGLPEPLAGAHRQRGDAVGGQAEQWRRVGGCLALYL